MRAMSASLEHMQDGIITNGGSNRLTAGGRCDRIDRSAITRVGQVIPAISSRISICAISSVKKWTATSGR